MRAVLSVLIPAALLPLASCVPPAAPGSGPEVVVSEVVSHHRLLDPPYWGQTIAILPWDEGEAGSATFAVSSHELFRHLEDQGFNVVPSDAGPNFWTFLGFGFEEIGAFGLGYWVPEPPAAADESARAQDIFDGTIANTPTGFAPNGGTDAPYVRYVYFDILDARASAPGSPARVYAGRLRSAGWCGNLVAVMGEMMAALFDAFPGESGAPRTIRIPSDRAC